MKPPKYVMFKEGEWPIRCAMRLTETYDGGLEYYRYAGRWGIGFRIHDDGTVKALTKGWETNHLNNIELVPISHEEWFEDNGGVEQGYVPEELWPERFRDLKR